MNDNEGQEGERMPSSPAGRPGQPCQFSVKDFRATSLRMLTFLFILHTARAARSRGSKKNRFGKAVDGASVGLQSSTERQRGSCGPTMVSVDEVKRRLPASRDGDFHYYFVPVIRQC